MSKFGKDLIEAMSEAVAYADGRKPDARVHMIEVPDVRATQDG